MYFNRLKVQLVRMTIEDVSTERATFGMAWFWFPEAQYGCVPGVIRTRVGFSGGSSPDPTYRTIGDHTETVDIEYDPKVISYAEMLDIFWKSHDPTSSCSRQYMSVIFYHNDQQKTLAEKSFEVAKKSSKKELTTEIVPAKAFYNAEDYHQKYLLQKHPELMELIEVQRGPELIKSHIAARLNGYIGGYGTKEEFEKEIPTLDIDQDAIDYVFDNFKYGNIR